MSRCALIEQYVQWVIWAANVTNSERDFSHRCWCDLVMDIDVTEWFPNGWLSLKLLIMVMQSADLTIFLSFFVSFFLSQQCQSIPSQGRVLNLNHIPPLPLPHTYTYTHTHPPPHTHKRIHTHIQSSAMPRGPDQLAARSDKPCLFISGPWGCALWALTFWPPPPPFVDLGTRGHLFSTQPGDVLLPSQEPHPHAPLTGKPWKEMKGRKQTAVDCIQSDPHASLNT